LIKIGEKLTREISKKNKSRKKRRKKEKRGNPRRKVKEKSQELVIGEAWKSTSGQDLLFYSSGSKLTIWRKQGMVKKEV